MNRSTPPDPEHAWWRLGIICFANDLILLSRDKKLLIPRYAPGIEVQGYILTRAAERERAGGTSP